MDKAIRCYIAEFLGTFALVFVGTAVAVLSGMDNLGFHAARWLEISFAFGFTLMVLVWVIGPVSGCHVNPAVTIPMALSGRFEVDACAGLHHRADYRRHRRQRRAVRALERAHQDE